MISASLKTHLEIRLAMCVYKTSFLHRPDDYIGFTSSCPPHILQQNCAHGRRQCVISMHVGRLISVVQRRKQLFISEGAIFIEFQSMTSSCLFNRGTTSSQTVTYNNNVFLPADTKSRVQTHTFCTRLVNKNRQNRRFYNSVGG